eukprot:gene23535-biopygen23839
MLRFVNDCTDRLPGQVMGDQGRTKFLFADAGAAGACGAGARVRWRTAALSAWPSAKVRPVGWNVDEPDIANLRLRQPRAKNCLNAIPSICETLVGKLDYSPHPPVSFTRLEHARAAVRIAAQKQEIAG